MRFPEGEVGGEGERQDLRALDERLEQQLDVGRGERHAGKFVKDEQLDAGVAGDDP